MTQKTTAKAIWTKPDWQSWGRHVTNEEDRRHPQQKCQSCQKQVMSQALFHAEPNTPAWQLNHPNIFKTSRAPVIGATDLRPETPRNTRKSHFKNAGCLHRPRHGSHNEGLCHRLERLLSLQWLGQRQELHWFEKNWKILDCQRLGLRLRPEYRSVSPVFFWIMRYLKALSHPISNIGTSKPKSWPTCTLSSILTRYNVLTKQFTSELRYSKASSDACHPSHGLHLWPVD